MAHRRTNFNDAIAAHQQLSGTDQRAMLNVEKVSRMKHQHGLAALDASASSGRRLSVKHNYGGKSRQEYKQEYKYDRRETRQSKHAPNTSTATMRLQLQFHRSTLEQTFGCQPSNRSVQHFHHVHHRHLASRGPKSASQLQHTARVSGRNNVRCSG